MNKEREVANAIIKHKDLILYCKDNFWKITCPDRCKYYCLCRSFRYYNKYGEKTVYPMDYIEQIEGGI